MTVGTFIQPDFEEMGGEPTEYKTAIEGSIAALARVGGAFAPHEQDTPNMTVRVDAGALWVSAALLEVAAQNTSTMVAPVTHPRIDRVVINATTGACYVVTGTEAASPSAPTIPSGYLPCCQIALTTATTAIDNTMLTDERLPVPGGGGGDIPVNGVYSNLGAAPATELGYGTWKSLGYDSEDVFLCHFDGVDTAFTDSGPYGLTITPTAYATQSATYKKFGNRSLACLNAGDYVSVTPGGFPFDFQYSDFTVDCWFYPVGLSGGYLLNFGGIAVRTTSSPYYIAISYPGSGGELYPYSGLASAWYHLAIVRKGRYIGLAVNGTFVTSGGWPQSNFTSLSLPSVFYLGGYGGVGLIGYVDEFRVSRVARWFDDFSVPTAQYETPCKWVRTA